MTPRQLRLSGHGPGRTWCVILLLLTVLAPVAFGRDALPPVSVTYYGEIGCSHCDVFLDRSVPRLEEQYGVTIEATGRDILNATAYAECGDRLRQDGRAFRVFPVLFIGNNAYQGTVAVREGIEAELGYYVRNGEFRSRVPAGMDGSQVGRGPDPGFLDGALPALPILLAGLADGINPCAFATMLFLVSLLALFGRSRAEVLAVGLVYAATVFATYLALGFGLLAAMRGLMNVSLLRTALRIAVSAGGAALAIVSVRDAVLIRAGRSSDAVLQLSLKTKQRIHTVMRKRLRSGGLIVGTVGVAFLVSLLELACTGQLYLPTIAYLVQTESTNAAEVIALLLYNAAFILPLLVLFVVVYSGVGSDRITGWFRRNAAAAKILTAAVLGVLALAIWFV